MTTITLAHALRVGHQQHMHIAWGCSSHPCVIATVHVRGVHVCALESCIDTRSYNIILIVFMLIKRKLKIVNSCDFLVKVIYIKISPRMQISFH